MVWKKNYGTVWRWFRIFAVFCSKILWINGDILHLYPPEDQLLSAMSQRHKPPKQETQRLFQGIQNPPRKRTMQQRLVSYIYSLAVALSGACFVKDPRFEDFEECPDQKMKKL